MIHKNYKIDGLRCLRVCLQIRYQRPLVMKDLREAMARVLDGTTLADVLDSMDKAEQQQKGVLNFYI